MTESSPLVDGMLRIHKIITRGINVAIQKCDEYTGKKGIPPDEAKGFSMYVTTLKNVIHSHHGSEDEIVYPFFKNKIEAPYARLAEEHNTIEGILLDLEQSLLEISSGGAGRLRGVLGELNRLWIPHIRTEEESFIPEKVHTVSGIKEQEKIAKMVGRHSSKNAGPGPLSVPFLFYNLEGAEREAFMIHIPWIVTKVLVPIIWKGQWKPMSPFLLLKSVV